MASGLRYNDDHGQHGIFMLFSMKALPSLCYILWWPCHDLAMITPCRVWITMIIPCHSMIVMFDHGCQPGYHLTTRSEKWSTLVLLVFSFCYKKALNLFVLATEQYFPLDLSPIFKLLLMIQYIWMDVVSRVLSKMKSVIFHRNYFFKGAKNTILIFFWNFKVRSWWILGVCGVLCPLQSFIF